MERKQNNIGDYETLSPQVVELAYAMNEAFDLQTALTGLKSRIAELGKLDKDQLLSSLRELKESGVSGDELLKKYNEIIRSNSDIRRIEHFEEMLLLGARLVPGEAIMTDGKVMTIAAPKEGTEEFEPTPDLVEVKLMDKSTTYRLEWTVPVNGEELPVRVDGATTVGRSEIKKGLDAAYEFGHKTPLSLLSASKNYSTINAVESAAKYKTLAINNALDKLDNINVHSDSSDTDIAACLEVLDETGALDKFLGELALNVAQDDVDSVSTNGARYSLLHNLLAYRKVKRGECDRVYRAKVDFEEIMGLWLVLKAQGKALLELQRDQNEQ